MSLEIWISWNGFGIKRKRKATGGDALRRYTRISYRDLNAQIVSYLMN
jgi:hypothetical protein